jgi:hypothetical protein
VVTARSPFFRISAVTPASRRDAERLVRDGIFVADHLKPVAPYPEHRRLPAAAGITELSTRRRLEK